MISLNEEVYFVHSESLGSYVLGVGRVKHIEMPNMHLDIWCALSKKTEVIIVHTALVFNDLFKAIRVLRAQNNIS